MNIGIIGAGHIGATLAQKLAAAGHHVKAANSRGAASLHDLAPGTPAYCTELTLSELHSALQAADQQRAPSDRDAATQRPMTWRGAPTHDDMIQNSRDSAV